MPSITIHNIDPVIYKQLQAQAAAADTSLNKFLKRMLARVLVPSQPIAKKSSFSEFSGLWTAADVAEFEKATEQFNQIDPELWKDE